MFNRKRLANKNITILMSAIFLFQLFGMLLTTTTTAQNIGTATAVTQAGMTEGGERGSPLPGKPDAENQLSCDCALSQTDEDYISGQKPLCLYATGIISLGSNGLSPAASIANLVSGGLLGLQYLINLGGNNTIVPPCYLSAITGSVAVCSAAFWGTNVADTCTVFGFALQIMLKRVADVADKFLAMLGKMGSQCSCPTDVVGYTGLFVSNIFAPWKNDPATPEDETISNEFYKQCYQCPYDNRFDNSGNVSAFWSEFGVLVETIAEMALYFGPNAFATGADNGMGLFFLDGECNNVTVEALVGGGLALTGNPSAKFCLQNAVVLFWAPSPVALVMDDSVEPSKVITNFQLDPALGSDKWYAWQGSSNMPLVVFDPEKTGTVQRAEQLFGQRAFGKYWDNGYQALGSLDANADGKLSGGELADLALWFDNNQNAKSEVGEVKTMAEAGITALYYQPDSVDTASADVRASKGYERLVNGNAIVGKSVDWFSAAYNTKEEAESALYAASQTNWYDTIVPISNAMEQPKVNSTSATGVWAFAVDKEFVSKELHNAVGTLAIIQDGSGKIGGIAVTEIPLQQNKFGLKAARQVAQLKNIQATKLPDGGQSLKFNVVINGQMSGQTTAKISPDGLTMTGVTQQSSIKEDKDGKQSRVNTSYTWKAGKIGKKS